VKDTARSRFKVVGQLGRGALADVYLCRLQGVAGFEKEVVVKRIVAEHATDPLFVRMFLDEARMVAKLTHANIVQVFEAGVEDGAPYIAMEYIRGVNLAMIIGRAHRDGKVHYGHFANIVAGICDGLEYAHAALDKDGEPLGIVHRDVKPANIVVSLEGIPKLLEFGMASAKGRLSHAESGSLQGKLRYMAPEQISQGPIDHRADVYGLGVTLYELATGRNPFGIEGDPEVEVLDRVLNGAFARPSEVVPGFPPELESIILSAIERDVGHRCGSTRELRERLHGFMTALPMHASNQRALAEWLRRLFPDFATLSKAGAVAALAGAPASDTTPAKPTDAAGRRTPPQSLSGLPATGNGATSGEQGSIPSTPAPQRSFLMYQAPPDQPVSPPLKRGQGTKWAAMAVAVVAVGVAVWALALREPPARTTVASSAEGPDPRLAVNAYLDAAESFIGEKRYDPALDLVAKAADLRVDDPILNVRIAHLRDQIANEATPGRASERRPQWRGDQPGKGPVLEPLGNEASASSGRTDTSARTTTVKRKARGREGNGGMAAERRAGRTRDEAARYPIPSIPSRPRRQAIVAAPPAPARAEAPAGQRSPALPPPLVQQPAIAFAKQPAFASANPPAARPAPVSEASNRESGGSKPSAPAASGTGSAAAQAARPAGSPAGRPIPAPELPRVYVTENNERLVRVCQQVESAAIALGGVDPLFARGITAPLRRQIRPNTPIYPMAMYYFVVHEGAQNRDRAAAAANLAAAHASGLIRQSSGQ
jgi:serine/threonine protein kinase